MYESDAAFLDYFKSVADPRGGLSRTESIRILRSSAHDKNGYLWKLRDEAVKRYLFRSKNDFLLKLNAFETELSEHFSKEVDEEVEREEMFLTFLAEAEEIHRKQVEDYTLHKDVADFFEQHEAIAAEKMAEEKRLRETAYAAEQVKLAEMIALLAIREAQQARLAVQSIMSQLLLAVGRRIETIEEDRHIAQMRVERKSLAQQGRDKKIAELQRFCTQEFERIKNIDAEVIASFFKLYATLSNYRRVQKTPVGVLLEDLDLERHNLAVPFLWLTHNTKTLKRSDEAAIFVMYAQLEMSYELITYFFGVDSRGRINSEVLPQHVYYQHAQDASRTMRFKEIGQFFSTLTGNKILIFEMNADIKKLFDILKNAYALAFHYRALLLSSNASDNPSVTQSLWILQQQVMNCFSVLKGVIAAGKSVMESPLLCQQLLHIMDQLVFLKGSMFSKLEGRMVAAVVSILAESIMRLREVLSFTKSGHAVQMGLFHQQADQSVVASQKTALVKNHLATFLTEAKFLEAQKIFPQIKQAFFEYIDFNGGVVRSIDMTPAFWMLKKLVYLAEKINTTSKRVAQTYFYIIQLIYPAYESILVCLYFPYVRSGHQTFQQADASVVLDGKLFSWLVMSLLPKSMDISLDATVEKLMSTAELAMLKETLALYLNFIEFEMLRDQLAEPTWVARCDMITTSLFQLMETLLNTMLSQERDPQRVNELSRSVIRGLIELQENFECYRSILEREKCAVPTSQTLLRNLKLFLQVYPVDMTPELRMSKPH